MRRALIAMLALSLPGCDFDGAVQECIRSGRCLQDDAGSTGGDGGGTAADAGSDAGGLAVDAGTDAGRADGGVGDGGSSDAGSSMDAGAVDAGNEAVRVELVINTPNLDAGSCGQAILQAVNAAGAPAPVSANTIVTLAVTAPPYDGGGVEFFSDHLRCQLGQASAFLLAAGSSSTTLGFASPTPGFYTATATADGGTSSAAISVYAGGPEMLLISSPPQAVQQQNCSAPVRVELRDGYGAPLIAPAAVPLDVSCSNPPFEMHSDNTCPLGNQTSTIWIDAGTQFTWVYFSGPGNPALVTVCADGGFGVAKQVETILSGGPSLSFGAPPGNAISGICSQMVQLSASMSSPTGIQVSLATTTGTTAFFSDPQCTSAITSTGMAPNTTNTAFFYRENRAGQFTLTASASGYLPANQGETVLPAPPHHLAFTSSPQTVDAGTCSAPVSIELQDMQNNATPASSPLQVMLQLAPSVTYFTAGCSSQISSVTISPGTSDTTFAFKATNAGIFQIQTQASLPVSMSSQSERVR